jgi:hypothetical protein
VAHGLHGQNPKISMIKNIISKKYQSSTQDRRRRRTPSPTRSCLRPPARTRAAGHALRSRPRHPPAPTRSSATPTWPSPVGAGQSSDCRCCGAGPRRHSWSWVRAARVKRGLPARWSRAPTTQVEEAPGGTSGAGPRRRGCIWAPVARVDLGPGGVAGSRPLR